MMHSKKGRWVYASVLMMDGVGGWVLVFCYCGGLDVRRTEQRMLQSQGVYDPTGVQVRGFVIQPCLFLKTYM